MKERKEGVREMKIEEELARLREEVETLRRQIRLYRASRREIGEYVSRITEMVRERRGGKIDAFMQGQAEVAARAWRQLDKIDEELERTPSILREAGSMGQPRSVLNPLYPLYDKLQRTVRQHFQALGLNYDTMPSKVTEAGALKESDALVQFMEGMTGGGEE